MADLYEMRASVIKALAHPMRIRIVEMLSQQDEMCICDIVSATGVSQPTISKHVANLKDAGVLETRREGTMVICRLRTPCVLRFLKCVDRVLATDVEERRSEIQGLIS